MDWCFGFHCRRWFALLGCLCARSPEEPEFDFLLDEPAAMVTGQVDAIARCDNKTADLLDKKPDVDLLQVAGTKHFTYPMNSTLEPFNNNDVRMALKLGIDRQGFVDD